MLRIESERTGRNLTLLAGAFAGGIVAELLGVPAGAILGAVLGALAVSLARPGPRLPRPFREAGKILLGTVVGVSFAPELLATVGQLLLPVSVGILLLILSGLGVSLVLHHVFGWDMPTALYASTPGGLSELALTSEEVGARTHIVVAVHTVRVITIVILGPPALTLLIGLWPDG
jgi:membrane AbrB-like protein